MMTREQIQKSNILSPGLIDGTVIIFLLADGNTYFMKPEGEGGYLKDKKGKFQKATFQQALDARYEYLQVNFEQEMTAAIEREVQKLGSEAIEKAKKIIGWVKEQHELANETGSASVQAMRQQNPNLYDYNKRNAQDFFERNPNALLDTEQLFRLIESQDYEAVYHVLGLDREPVFYASFDSEIPILLFSKMKLDATPTEIKEQGAIWVKAKANTRKRYFNPTLL